MKDRSASFCSLSCRRLLSSLTDVDDTTSTLLLLLLVLWLLPLDDLGLVDESCSSRRGLLLLARRLDFFPFLCSGDSDFERFRRRRSLLPFFRVLLLVLSRLLLVDNELEKLLLSSSLLHVLLDQYRSRVRPPLLFSSPTSSL